MRKASLWAVLCCGLAAGPAPAEASPNTASDGNNDCQFPNRPVVRSAPGGSFYARSVPHEKCGTKGVTKIFKTGRDQDELVGEYPVYMGGDIFIGGSESFGYHVVHLKTKYPINPQDYESRRKIDKLDFYGKGTLIKSYTTEDLDKIGLRQQVDGSGLLWIMLGWAKPGDFTVDGIDFDHCSRRTYHFILDVMENTDWGKSEQDTPPEEQRLRNALRKFGGPKTKLLIFDLKDGHSYFDERRVC